MSENINRKTMRLKFADYNAAGVYFLTLCTKDRKQILSKIIDHVLEVNNSDDPQAHTFIVGTDAHQIREPRICLTEIGKIADKYIRQLSEYYAQIDVIEYVIMPNHVHILLYVKNAENGPSRTPVPTPQNTVVAKFISTYKRFCNKEIGENIWQYRSYDHIVRDERDYDEIIKYIRENPMNWYYDELYST